MREIMYDEIKVGDRASISKTISETDIYLFAGITGDFNPVHVNEDFASQSRFGTRIAHGMLVAGLISTVLGTELPGVNTIYLGQELRFKAPVKIGTTVTATCEVIEKRDDKKIVVLKSTVTDSAGNVLIDGTATVMKPDRNR